MIAMNPDALPAKVNVLFNIFKRHKENIMVNRKRIGLQMNVHELLNLEVTHPCALKKCLS